MEPVPHAVLDAHPVTLGDGSEVTVRSLRGADRRRLEAVFDELSDESRYTRFGGPKASLTDAELTYLAEVDNHDHEALLALDEDGSPIGVARYVRESAQGAVAEAAFAIVDAWQARGLGTELARLLAGRARAEGVTSLRFDVLAENTPALALARGLGKVARSSRDGAMVQLLVELPPEP
jgi:RimJ/RimL family protein N-acetyltransferase